MTATEVMPLTSTLLVDSRDTCLRATWHPSDRLVVLSHWRDGVCASTFRLAGADITRLTSFLVAVLGDQATIDEPARPTPSRPAVSAWPDRTRAWVTNLRRRVRRN